MAKTATKRGAALCRALIGWIAPVTPLALAAGLAVAQTPPSTAPGAGGASDQPAVAAAASAPAPGATEPLPDLVARGWQAISDGRLAAARTLGEQALARAQREHGPDSVETAAALTLLGQALLRLGQHAVALQRFERAQALRERLQGTEHPDYIRTMGRVAATEVLLGRPAAALARMQRVVPVAERVFGARSADLALALDELGNAQRLLADHAASVRSWERALQIMLEARGPDDRDTAAMRLALGTAYHALAQYDKALPQIEQALAWFEKNSGPEHPSTGRALNNLASVYTGLGQPQKALPLRLRALEVSQKVLGPEHEETALNLNNLAQTYAALNQFEKAIPLLERAVAIREKTFGPEHPRTAVALNNLSRNLYGAGQTAKAMELQLRSLAIREKSLGNLHPETASSLNNVATLYRAQGQLDQALPFQQRAYAAYATSLGMDHPNTALVRSGLAQMHLAQGDRPLAIALMKQSVNAQQAMREQAARIGTEALQAYTESVSTFYQDLATALSDAGRLPEAQLVLDMLKEEEQFNFVRRSGRVDPGRTRIGYNAAEQEWARRYAEISARLAALGAENQGLIRQAGQPQGLSPEQRARRQAIAGDLEVARKAFESFLSEMRADFASRGAARSADMAEASLAALAELRDILKGLGEGSALLQIYLTGDRVNFLLTTTGVQLARNAPIASAELNRQIVQLRRLLRDPKSDPLPAAQALYRVLLAPVAQDLEQAGVKTVMLSLDGSLRYLPFAALHDGQRFALERWSLPVYTSVARERLRDAVSRSWRAAGLGVTRRIGEFEPLPGVRQEMDSIIRTQAATSAPRAAGVMPGEVHLDEAFTVGRLQEVSQGRFAVMHLASHFRFSPGTEANSFLLMGDGSQLTLADLRQRNLRFDQVDLLTLSACETGLGGGRDERGREIEGFGVIAQQQGAKAVLATLWSVADQSTAVLMADTYRLREAQGLPKVEALRQAQLGLRAQSRYGHPFYWAPFILMGNWK